MMGNDNRRFAPRHATFASRRGTAIVPALVLVVIVSTLSMILVQQSLAKNKEQRMSVDAKRAFYMAEAGIAEGFAGLNIGKSGNVGSENEPAEFANGLFFTTATEEGSGLVTLQSTGMCGAGRATLSQVVQRSTDTVGSLGFFGSRGVTVQGGALIDSYKSQDGPYVPFAGVLGMGGEPTTSRLGCNGDITASGTLVRPAVVLGDARPGPAGTLFRTGTTIITGSTAPSLSSVQLPGVQAPTVPVGADLLADKAGQTTVAPSGVQGFANMKVTAGATLVLVGPAVIVTRQLDMAASAQLHIDATAGPVKLFVMNAVSIDPTATIKTLSTDPLSVNVQIGAAGPLPLGGTAKFYGTIFAPDADVSIEAGYQVFGSVGAKSLVVKTGAQLHFDTSLSGGEPNADGTPHIMGWHIVELPNVPVVSLRFDALKALKDSGIIPKLSKNAHVDIGATPP